MVVGEANGLGALAFESPFDGLHKYVGDDPITLDINWVFDPSHIVFVTALMVTVGLGLTVIVVEAHPPLKSPPFRFLA